MANALPQAIGIQAVDKGRQVIALAGDGGLSMLMGELLTLRQLKLPVKVEPSFYVTVKGPGAANAPPP